MKSFLSTGILQATIYIFLIIITHAESKLQIVFSFTLAWGTIKQNFKQVFHDIHNQTLHKRFQLN